MDNSTAETLFIILIVILACLPLDCEGAEPWTKEEVTYQIADEILFYIDRCQTQEAVMHGFKEHNFILGKHPSRQTIDNYFIAVGIIHPVITHYLPRKYKMIWLKSTTMLQYIVIMNNGFKLKWRW